MLHVLLYQPEIPPNTGNIIRLCANTGARLHLIEPLGFDLDDAKLRRAGLDYHEYAELQRHPSLASCLAALGQPRVFAFTTRGQRRHDAVAYQAGDALLFGPESRGLPDDIVADLPPGHDLRLPMRPNQRSLNLSNCVAVAVFEAWRQWDYPGADPAGQMGTVPPDFKHVRQPVVKFRLRLGDDNCLRPALQAFIKQ